MLETTEELHFYLSVDGVNLFFNPLRAEGLSIISDSSPKFEFAMKPRNPNDNFNHRDLLCFIKMGFHCSKQDYDFVDALIKGVFKSFPGSSTPLPYVVYDRECIDVDGNLREGYRPTIEMYPPSLQQLHKYVFNFMTGEARRILTLLRWGQSCDSATEPFSSTHLYWKTTQDEYHAAGLHRHKSFGRSPAGLAWEELDVEEFQTLYRSDAEEPLAHHLLREAIIVSDSSPRSALLIVAAAIEVGVKQYISNIAPQTRWILTKMASPPVFRLFKDVIPDIHMQIGNDLSFWPKLKPLFKTCQDLFDHRNELAHSGNFKLSHKEVDDYIEAGSDILYIIDALNGHDWAKAQVSYRIRVALGWPNPRHRRVQVIVQSG